MGSLSDDLDRFLRTDGLQIYREAVCPEPLTGDGIGRFPSMNLNAMSKAGLESLQYRPDDLREGMEDQESESRTSRICKTRDIRLFKSEGFPDMVRNRPDRPEEDIFL